MGYSSENQYLLALLRASKESKVRWHEIAAVVEAAGTARGLVTGEVEPPNVLAAQVVLAVTSEDLAEARDTVDAWSERPIKVWAVLDDDYPTNLRTVFNRPPFIFSRGTWVDERDRRSIAVVGTRKPSKLGLKQAGRMATELARRGITVVSGLALGVDTMAHKAAIEADGATVAVMGGGLDSIYPRENEELADRIVEHGGALLSQFLPDQRPMRGSFLMRNVVMSGLARGTVVIEAGPTSGAKMQARAALEQSRPVFLLKSLVEKYDWARDYADQGRYGSFPIVVTDVDDVMAALEGPLDESAPRRQLSLETDLPLPPR